ncbi:MAG: hypothetical protein WC564_00465 [Patescibacteria group bacterium]
MNLALTEKRRKLTKIDRHKTGAIISPVFVFLSFMLIGAVTNIEIKMGSNMFFIALAILFLGGYLLGYCLPRKLRKCLSA